jgi:RNA-binding protein 5/10
VQNALLASAMQAAQWSINNGYAAAPGANVLPGGTGIGGAAAGGVIGKPAAIFWPPNFDTHGSAYVFQPKTGYFLEPLTEFYYCPKSKLYYAAKDGLYYHYDATLDPPFKRFQPSAPTEPEESSSSSGADHSAGQQTHALGGEGGGSAEKRPLVSVNLTQKIKVKAAIAPPKKVLKDLAKWEAVQKEEEEVAEREEQQQQQQQEAANSVFVKRQDSKQGPAPAPADSDAQPQQPSAAVAATAATPSTDEKPAHPPAATAAGQPVCLLCQRKFASMEILARHEKESKLHLENLAKQKEKGQQPQYRDRAEERREKFGSIPDHLPKGSDAVVPPPPSSSSSAATTASSPPINLAAFILPPQPPPAKPVAVSEDQSNPGNQMLRKMGWKEGQGLGKDGDGKEVAVGVEISESKSHSSMHQTIRTTSGAGTGAGSGGGVSGNYKESVYAASRSRFEQILKSEKKYRKDKIRKSLLLLIVCWSVNW